MSRLTQVSLQPNVLVPPIVGSCPGQRFQTRQTDQILGGWVTVHAQSGLALLYELLQKETFVGGPLPTWEEGQWFPLWVHWTGHFGSMVGGISTSPGLAGGMSVADMAASTSAVSGNRAACESTPSSFS